ncbi:MAG: HD domain-containing protein [Acidobacteriaceae bacterium]
MPVTQQRSSSISVPSEPPLCLAQIISALSFAIDLTEGAVPGHALRTCVLGMRVAHRAGLSVELLNDLYFALLLKDIGCSSNAARVGQIVGGDDRILKAGIKLENWTNPYNFSRSGFKLFWSLVLPDADPLHRLARVVRVALHSDKNNMELIALRCERGAEIIRKIGFSETVAEAIQSLDEHWDGHGYPNRLRGDELPILARILSVAQHLDVFATARSPQLALKVLKERSGFWFDPRLVEVALELDRRGNLWHGSLATDNHETTLRMVVHLAPLEPHPLAHQEIDRLCEAFADVVDAKSPFTYHHSVGVAEVACSIARILGLPEARCQLVRRASLLHDLGKLSLPNTILDKTGGLSQKERNQVQQHPRLTRQILARIEPFKEIAAIAGAHHERLDGSGYPDHLTAAELPLEVRILAVADIYRALTEKRPYRPGLTHTQVMRILQAEAPRKLDADVVAALEVWRRSADAPAQPTHPLPPVEIRRDSGKSL